MRPARTPPPAAQHPAAQRMSPPVTVAVLVAVTLALAVAPASENRGRACQLSRVISTVTNSTDLNGPA
jgi:flagellin-like protein